MCSDGANKAADSAPVHGEGWSLSRELGDSESRLSYEGNQRLLPGILGDRISRHSGDTPAFVAYFSSYYGMMNYIAGRKGITRDELSHRMIYPFVCGGLTGMITWTINYPVDLVKTRIQLDGLDGRERQYKTSWDCFVKAWKRGRAEREGGLREREVVL